MTSFRAAWNKIPQLTTWINFWLFGLQMAICQRLSSRYQATGRIARTIFGTKTTEKGRLGPAALQRESASLVLAVPDDIGLDQLEHFGSDRCRGPENLTGPLAIDRFGNKAQNSLRVAPVRVSIKGAHDC